LIGQQVGRFRIVAKLGEGGMGSVWRAEDPLLGRFVALKFLSEGSETAGARQRFLREARVTSSFDHPGLATVFDAGEHEGRLFIAIAFVEGETISDALTAGPLSLADAVRIGAEAAGALEYAHVRGIVHRDISSRNIMRGRDGHVVLIDFGLAVLRDTRELTTSGTALGTLAYVAPEVLRGEPASRLSDLYGLGVVLYEMVTGRLPFQADLPAPMVYAILNARPTPPHELRPDASAALERLVLKALAKDPARRHPSAAELAAALATLRPNARRRRSTPVAPMAPATPRRRTSPGDLPEHKILAVLPFRSLADEAPPAGAAEFARGLAETLSASLSRVPKLQIFPPGPPAGVDDGEDTRATARRLGANLLLSGAVRRVGDQIRVSYSLIGVRLGVQLGGDRLDGSATNLLALEDALLDSVVRTLRIQAGTARRMVPLDAAAHERYLRALGHLQRRDSEKEIDRAIELLEGLVASEGDTAPVHAALARAYLRKAAITYQSSWRARAEVSCRIALSLDSHSPEVLVILAKLMLQTGRMDEALGAVQQALALQSQNLDALFCLVQAHESRGRFAEAEKAALQAVALRPEYWLTYERLALVYFRWGRFEEAATYWGKVVEMVPDHEHASSNLGAALFHLDRFEDAIAAYRRSLEVHPQASAYTGLGTVLFFTGQNESALEMFEQAVTLRPADPRAWGNLGDAQRWTPGRELQSARSLERAEDLLRQQVASSHDDADAWSQLAKVLAKRGRPAEAREAIERALALAPENVSCLARAVTVYHLVGDRERAIQNLRAALESGYSRVELCRDPELEELRRSPDAQRILTDDLITRARTLTPRTPGGR
jgi:eukaryotic-like serine/threonine-protein kinase